MTVPTIGYYHLDQTNGDLFGIVTVDFWNAHQGLDYEGSEEDLVPPGFYAVAEAIYEHEFGTTQEAKDALEKAGFVEKVIMQ